MEKWKVRKHHGKCFVTGRSLEPGESFYSAIIVEEGVLRRVDFSENAFSDEWRDRAFSFWKSRVPFPEEEETPKHRLVDTETLLAFFRKLVEDKTGEHHRFAYLIALLLMRKKRITLKTMEFDQDGDWLILVERKTKRIYRLRDPRLTPDELSPLREQLTELFESPEMFIDEDADSEEAGDGEVAEDGDLDSEEDTATDAVPVVGEKEDDSPGEPE